MNFVIEKKYERAHRKVSLLEKMIEDKTRELYLEHQKVEKSNQYLSRILQSMAGGVIVTDHTFTVVLVNGAAAIILGEESENLLGSELLDVFPVDGIAQAIEERAYHDLPSEQTELVLARNPDGRPIPISCSFATILGESDTIESVVCLFQDLTDMKALERQLVRAQKLESVGQLAAGIAHEINTPIQYVRDNTVFVRDEFKNLSSFISAVQELLAVEDWDESLATKREAVVSVMNQIDLPYLLGEIPLALEQSFEGAESVARIVRSMKAFSHPGTEDKAYLDINEAIESTATVSRNEWKYVADMTLNLDPSIPMVRGYAGELSQVFLNLIVNAAHAIGDATEGGKAGKRGITITTRHRQGIVEISISDAGIGIPVEIRERIFDPFFTTKAVGKGTGQGLSMAYSTIVERHNGSIDFLSEVGKGTTFRISLPVDGKEE